MDAGIVANLTSMSRIAMSASQPVPENEQTSEMIEFEYSLGLQGSEIETRKDTYMSFKQFVNFTVCDYLAMQQRMRFLREITFRDEGPHKCLSEAGKFFQFTSKLSQCSKT
jgi:hypothetical protein